MVSTSIMYYSLFTIHYSLNMRMVIISFLLISVGVALLPHLVYLIAKAISLINHHPIAYKPFGYTALAMIAVWLILFVWGYFLRKILPRGEVCYNCL